MFKGILCLIAIEAVIMWAVSFAKDLEQEDMEEGD